MFWTKVLVSVDNKFKGWFNNEFAEKLLVCCAVANIAKTVDVNFFSCSSSSKSNTYNALKMMGEDVCKGVVAHVYIAWTEHFDHSRSANEPQRCGGMASFWVFVADLSFSSEGFGTVYLPR